MRLIAGAYPAAPRPDDPAFDRTLVADSDELGLSGLELAWSGGSLHPRGDEHVTALPESWRHVVTLIPDTMVRWLADPAYGLASTDADGRGRALDQLRVVRDHLDALTERLGHDVALAVLVHSAPRAAGPVQSSGDHFGRSLAEAASWDWLGAELLVEHCDSLVPDQVPAKGFLSLDDEIAAVTGLSGTRTSSGLVINWGRSVIEGRNRETAVEHVVRAGPHLRGVMFSGVAAAAGQAEWVDGHLPTDDLDPTSLLRPEDVAEVLDAARCAGALLLFAGAKVVAAPESTSATDRAEDVLHSLSHVARAAGGSEPLTA